jgi:hypothetical protein
LAFNYAVIAVLLDITYSLLFFCMKKSNTAYFRRNIIDRNVHVPELLVRGVALGPFEGGDEGRL